LREVEENEVVRCVARTGTAVQSAVLRYVAARVAPARCGGGNDRGEADRLLRRERRQKRRRSRQSGRDEGVTGNTTYEEARMPLPLARTFVANCRAANVTHYCTSYHRRAVTLPEASTRVTRQATAKTFVADAITAIMYTFRRGRVICSF